MSIATEISRLQTAKADIKTAIEDKGVTVPSNALLDTYDTYISQISSASSSWKLLATKEFSVSTTSTSASSVGYIDCGSEASTKDKIIYIRVRDKAGKRAGYFIGSDNFIINTNKANGSTSAQTTILRAIHRYSTSSQYGLYTTSSSTGYGVYAYSVVNKSADNGRINIYSRYNSTNSLTINGTYLVEVYTLDYPDGKSVFNI